MTTRDLESTLMLFTRKLGVSGAKNFGSRFVLKDVYVIVLNDMDTNIYIQFN